MGLMMLQTCREKSAKYHYVLVKIGSTFGHTLHVGLNKTCFFRRKGFNPCLIHICTNQSALAELFKKYGTFPLFFLGKHQTISRS